MKFKKLENDNVSHTTPTQPSYGVIRFIFDNGFLIEL